MYRRDGRERIADFATALEMQDERGANGDPTGFYISTGFYGKQLARYYDIFPPAQIKVFLMEELQSDGPRALSQMFGFLGVDAAVVPDTLKSYNRSGVASSHLVNKFFQYRRIVAPLARQIVPHKFRASIRRKFEDKLEKPPLQPEIREMLRDTYAADVRLVERLTGKACGHWLE
jgi:hypothetical protein